MKEHYYYNKNLDSKGNHEVHTKDCKYLPSIDNRNYIGYFSNCKEAISDVIQSTGKYNFDGCFFCCRDCHKG